MSYSFSIKATSKDDAIKQIKDQFDQVVVSQPGHAADRDAAVAAGQAFVSLLADLPQYEIHVSMHGSLGWNHNAPDKYIGAGVGISASLHKAEFT